MTAQTLTTTRHEQSKPDLLMQTNGPRLRTDKLGQRVVDIRRGPLPGHRHELRATNSAPSS